MRALAKMLAWVAVGFSVLVPLLGWLLSGEPLHRMMVVYARDGVPREPGRECHRLRLRQVLGAEPLFRLGPRSNRLMIVWGAATVAVLLVATAVAGLRSAFRVTALNANEWALVVVAAIIRTFWIEVKKLVARQHHVRTVKKSGQKKILAIG